jgi:lysophospholipase L1-like esterase
VVAVNVIVILGMLVLAEGAIRIRQTLKYGTAATVEEYYATDPATGLRVPVANLSKGHISINSLGFRGPEIAMPKPPGTVRIAFLGASTTWCGEVSSNDHVWPSLVTNSLARAFPAVRFDHINAGVPGYTMRSILKNLELRVAQLQPDVIVIYEAANNLSGEMRELAAQNGLIAEARMQEMTWPSRYSLLWHLVEKNLRVISAERATTDPARRLEAKPETLGVEYRRELTAVVREAQKTSKLVAVATFTIQPRPDQTAEQQSRAALSAFFYMPFITPRMLIAGYDRYNQIGREVASETGALLIEGESEIPGDPAHFTDTVHFTDAGSKAMAGRVSRALSASPAFRAAVSGVGSPR